MAKKCVIEKEEFLSNAKSLNLSLGELSAEAAPKEFSTGSFGWFFSGKVNVVVNGKSVPVQVSCNMAVVGSKPAKE